MTCRPTTEETGNGLGRPRGLGATAVRLPLGGFASADRAETRAPLSGARCGCWPASLLGESKNIELLYDNAANLCARITAVQLCGLLNLTNALADLSNLAAGQRQPPTLRLAAMASLRTVGPATRPPPILPSLGADGNGPGAHSAAVAAVPPSIADK
jgi:hypothetical protein